MRDYLEALDSDLPPETREVAPQKHVSPVGPQAAWSIRPGRARFGYATNYYIDTEASLILDVEASPARFGLEAGTTSL